MWACDGQLAVCAANRPDGAVGTTTLITGALCGDTSADGYGLWVMQAVLAGAEHTAKAPWLVSARVLTGRASLVCKVKGQGLLGMTLQAGKEGVMRLRRTSGPEAARLFRHQHWAWHWSLTWMSRSMSSGREGLAKA